MKKKIIILPAEYPTKDNPLAGIFVEDQVKMLVNHGYDVSVFYNYFISLKKFNFKNLKYLFLKSKIIKKKKLSLVINYLFSTFFNIIKLKIDYTLTKKNLIKYINTKGSPDLIICHFAFPTGITAKKILEEFNIPYIIVEHSTGYFSNLYTNFQVRKIKEALKFASKVVTVSSFLKKKLQKISSKNNFKVIGNVIDNNFFEIKNQNKKKKQKLKNFLIISELVKKKQILELLKVFNYIKNKKFNFVLNIVGIGPEYKSLKHYVMSHNLNRNVKFLLLKNKKQISLLLDKTDYLISCSKIETFGITIAESIAKGVPPIVLNSGGPNDFINPYNSIKVDSFNELKKALVEVINKDKKFDKKKMNKYIKNNFSEASIMKKYTKLIKNLNL